MKRPKRLRLFKVYVSYFIGGSRKVYILDNCINVKGRIAQVYKWRVRPIFANLCEEDRRIVFDLLKKSNGTINAENYESLLPYMIKPSLDAKLIVIDLDSSHGVHLGYLQMSMAKLL